MKPMQPDAALGAVVGNNPIAADRSHQEDLGVHQAERPAGLQEPARHQRRRQAASGVRRQEPGDHVRHDQAGQQAPQLASFSPRPKGAPAGAPFLSPTIFLRPMAGEYIFTMRDLRKVVPPSREILKGIYLAFFPGAKIGVLGANGAGKSSLLRIMAGVDKDFLGDARPLPGTRIGYLPQEPQLDPAKDVRGNVEDGVARAAGAARPVQRDQRPVRRADGRRRDDPAAGEAGQPAGADRRARPLGARPQDRHRHGRAAAPAGRRRRRQDLRRRAAPGGALPGAAGAARHAAARRAHQPPRRRERVVAGAVSSREFPGTVVAVTHDRYFLDNVAGWILELYQGAGIPVGRATTPPGWSRSSGGSPGGEAGLGPAEDAAARARVGPDGAPGAAGQEQGADHRVRGAPRGGGAADRGQRRDPDPRARAAGRRGGGRRRT